MPNFTYSRENPDGNLTPAQNRPDMTINTNSADSIWTIDHYGFNNNNGGLHQKITFPLNITLPVPIEGQFVPVVFTQNDAFTVPQLFFYTGTPAQSADQYSAGTNGSTMLFGGIILKWGLKSGPGSHITVTYPKAFPHATFGAFAIGNGQDRIRTYDTREYMPDTFVAAANSVMGEGDLFFWMAIGN